MTTGRRAAVAFGAACALALLLSPALLASAGADVVLPAVLPLGFFAAGSVAHVLRPGHRVADGLLAVGVLHVTALVGAVAVAGLRRAPDVALLVSWLSVVLYALGFVALLDLLARYPTGRYAWAALRPAVLLAAALAVVVATVAVLGSRRTPSVLGLEAGSNPLHVPAFAGLTGAVAGVVVLPVVGLVLLVRRYSRAPALDRARMRWPIVTALVTAVGLITTRLAENTLGADVQTALFVTAAAALPASFLIGLLRHTEEAQRLAEVEASRARLAEVADAERRRIERNLHDGVQPQILALLAQVELTRTELGGRDDGIDRGLRDIGEGLRQAHRDLRELARGVHPAVLTDHGLPEAVRSALARLPLRCELVVSTEVEHSRYPPHIEGAAYFLVLEGLSNAMKHADASTARITLTGHDDLLDVTVSDPGRGFEHAAGGGTGLLGLSDRVTAVGGRLEVETRPGAGTTLRGLLPVHGRAAG